MVCSIVKAELFYGSMRSANPQRSLARQRAFVERFVSLLFDDRTAESYGLIRAHLTNAGTPIGPNDLLIAAIAVANAVTLVTHNTCEFARVPGLSFKDWES